MFNGYKRNLDASINSPRKDPPWQLFYLGLGIAILALTIFSFFPSTNFLEKITKEIFLFFLTPWFFIIFILKEKFANFGFNLENKKQGFYLALIALLISLFLGYFLINFSHFSKSYSIPQGITNNFGLFILYELVLVNIALFFQEYFFKGFLLSLTKEKMGYYSIAFQAIIYLTPLAIISTSLWNIVPLVMISIFGGIISYKTNSFFYSYLYALLFIIFLDAYLIYLG